MTINQDGFLSTLLNRGQDMLAQRQEMFVQQQARARQAIQARMGTEALRQRLSALEKAHSQVQQPPRQDSVQISRQAQELYNYERVSHHRSSTSPVAESPVTEPINKIEPQSFTGVRTSGGSATWEWMRPGGSTGATYQIDAGDLDGSLASATFTFNAPAWTTYSEVGGVGTDAEVTLELYNHDTGEWDVIGTDTTGYRDASGRGRQDAVFEVENLAPYLNDGQVQARVVRADGEKAHVGAEQDGLRMDIEHRMVLGEPLVGNRETGHPSQDWVWMRPGGHSELDYSVDGTTIANPEHGGVVSFQGPAWTTYSESGGVGTDAQVEMQLFNQRTGEWDSIGVGQTGYGENGLLTAEFEVDSFADYLDASGQIQTRVLRADGETAHVGGTPNSVTIQPYEPATPDESPVTILPIDLDLPPSDNGATSPPMYQIEHPAGFPNVPGGVIEVENPNLQRRGELLSGSRETGHPSQEWVWMRPNGHSAINYSVDASRMADPNSGGEITFRAPAWTYQSEIGGVKTDAQVEMQLFNQRTGEWDTIGVGQTGYGEDGLLTAAFEVDSFADYLDASGQIETRVLRADGETAHVGGGHDSLNISPYTQTIAGDRTSGGSSTWEWIRPGGSTGADYKFDATNINPETSATFTFNGPAWTKQSEIGGVGTDADVTLQLFNVTTGKWDVIGTDTTGYQDASGRGRQDAQFSVDRLADYVDESGQIQALIVRADGETAHVGAERDSLRMIV